MNVLMFGWEFPPYKAGGLATATLGLVKGLLRRNEVTLVVPFPVEQNDLAGLDLRSTSGVFQQLTTRRVASPLTPYMSASAYELERPQALTGTRMATLYGENLASEVERFAQVASAFAAEFAHDVIDVHDWMTYKAGLLAQKISGRPLVVHVHATEFDRSGDNPNPEICRREWEGLNGATLIIANSNQLKRQVVRRYHISAEKIDVVHWGIEADRTEYHLDSPSPLPGPVVLFLGRVTRQKGPDYFVEMARRVADYVPRAQFIVAGSGDMLPQLVERAVALGLAERVHFAGPLQGEEVYRALRAADVCVMPSVSEPFGLVALESIKSGTPCLVPRESGVAEVLQNALKVDFWDVEEMANKIVSLLEHAELHDELSERGLAELSSPRFGLDEPAQHTMDVYERAVALGGTTA